MRSTFFVAFSTRTLSASTKGWQLLWEAEEEKEKEGGGWEVVLDRGKGWEGPCLVMLMLMAMLLRLVAFLRWQL